jgi:3-methylcrotonyl-CoA carboxylase alpha subunit
VFLDGESWRLTEIDPLAARASEDPTAGRLTAPMPGRVTQLMVEPGTSVRRGQPLIVIEAMKMEHTVTAPADGVVETVRFAPGDLVEEGAELIALAPERQEPG